MTKKTCPGFTVKVVVIVSKYTTEVRFICETEAGLSESVGYSGVNEVIQKAIPKIFSFDFPIFDEIYRNVLETKILKHYYTREIGLETYGLWKLKLDTKLNEIMPYYNQLYESATLEFNPLYDVDYTDTRTGGNTQTSENNKTTTSKETLNTNINASGNTTGNTENSGDRNNVLNIRDINRFSDLPQGTINDMFVESNGYLTNATLVDRNEETTENVTNNQTETSNYADKSDTNENRNRDESVNDNGKIQTTEEYVNTIKGKRGGQSYASMILEFRQSLINVDVMVIDELKDLFINLW